MSNFLNNLVARTLNLAPVVQPWIRSRFEPVTPIPDQSVEVETPVQPPVTTTKIFETRVIEPKPVVEREQPHIDVQNVINTIRNTHVESKHEIVQHPVVEKIHERTHTETRINTEKSTDSRLEIRENRILEAPPSEVEKNPLNQRLHEPEPLTLTKEVTVPTPQPIVPRVVTRVEPAPIAPIVQRFETRVEPTETINVTIGRVDVRAVFSAQASKAPVRTSSTSALDDYLKQRSEGRR